jgi:hypothetical protein
VLPPAGTGQGLQPPQWFTSFDQLKHWLLHSPYGELHVTPQTPLSHAGEPPVGVGQFTQLQCAASVYTL